MLYTTPKVPPRGATTSCRPGPLTRRRESMSSCIRPRRPIRRGRLNTMLSAFRFFALNERFSICNGQNGVPDCLTTPAISDMPVSL